ncbi:MAG: acetylglutamate kinase [Candidatus Margulisiibacteriota bacterium]|nr:acetylglutamate kinase [Candidatus Margulisiibacteriota bacterium]
MKNRIKKARIVMEALPYIMRFHGKVIVIKYGGAAMTDPALENSVMRDAVLLKYVGMNPVIVHGGGPEINRALKKKKLETRFVKGLRVTDRATMEVVARVLGDKINKKIASLIKKNGGRARGFAGLRGRIIKAHKLVPLNDQGIKIDLGYTGTVTGVRNRDLKKCMEKGYIPVLAPIGVGAGGRLYNINADQAAAAVASHLDAAKLILLTDVQGVLDAHGKLISNINTVKARRMIKSGQLSGGMIPKVRNSLAALRKGVEQVHIIDGRIPHAILLEIFTDKGIGTLVERR